MATPPDSSAPQKKPRLTRRDVEYHQAVARGRAAQEASQRGFDPRTLDAVRQGERGSLTTLASGLVLGPLTLQAQLALNEYAHVCAAAVAAGMAAPDATKKLLHYVSIFSHPKTTFEILTEHDKPALARMAVLDAEMIEHSESLASEADIEAAVGHVMRELRLMEAFGEGPKGSAPGKPESPPPVPRRARARRAGRGRAG